LNDKGANLWNLRNVCCVGRAEQRAWAAKEEALASLAAAAEATESRLQGQLQDATRRSDALQQQMDKLEEQVRVFSSTAGRARAPHLVDGRVGADVPL
jgi:hypothetical protein